MPVDRIAPALGAVTADPAAAGVAARPVRWLGAPSAGGLSLPAALPAAGQMYGPRGVWLDDERLVVADTGNHRVLIWHGLPGDDHAPADVVLGQPDFTSDGAQATGLGPALGMRLPTGVLVHDGRLIVADAWNHRLLIWDAVPSHTVPPDHVVGQASPDAVAENRGGECGPTGLYWPFGLAMAGPWLVVADTGNRRVLAFDGIPHDGDEPVAVLGQPHPRAHEENRGGIGPASFRWPHDIACDRSDPTRGEVLLIADAGDHRVLGWTGTAAGGAAGGGAGTVPAPSDRPADLVLGQPDFTTAAEFPYGPQGGAAMRFPYAIDVDGGSMAVADTANNRLLWWHRTPRTSGVPADGVLGQHDLGGNGENRWDAVRHDSFCWPYGLSLHRRHLAVADSGNNRVMIWEVER